VCSARMANSLSGYSRAARDFLSMLCVLKRVVPHSEGFVDGQQWWLPSSVSGYVCVLLCFIRRYSTRSWFVPTSWAKKKEKKLTKNLYHKKMLNLSRPISYKKPDMRLVPILSDYLVKLVILASRAIQKPAIIHRFVSLEKTSNWSILKNWTCEDRV